MHIGIPAETAHARAPACTCKASYRVSRGLAGLMAMGREIRRG